MDSPRVSLYRGPRRVPEQGSFCPRRMAPRVKTDHLAALTFRIGVPERAWPPAWRRAERPRSPSHWLGRVSAIGLLSWLRERVVGDDLTEHRCVGYQHLNVVRRSQLRRAYADVLDHAKLVFDAYRVANPEGPFEQEIH